MVMVNLLGLMPLPPAPPLNEKIVLSSYYMKTFLKVILNENDLSTSGLKADLAKRNVFIFLYY